MRRASSGYSPGAAWAARSTTWSWSGAPPARAAESLAEIARPEIGSAAGITAALAVLFIVIIAMAGLGIAVVNALAESSWGTFTIAMTIPIAMAMGIYMFRIRPGTVQARPSR